MSNHTETTKHTPASATAAMSRSKKPYTLIWTNSDTGEVGIDSHHTTWHAAVRRGRNAWAYNQRFYFEVYGRDGRRLPTARSAQNYRRDYLSTPLWTK